MRIEFFTELPTHYTKWTNYSNMATFQLKQENELEMREQVIKAWPQCNSNDKTKQNLLSTDKMLCILSGI